MTQQLINDKQLNIICGDDESTESTESIEIKPINFKEKFNDETWNRCIELEKENDKLRKIVRNLNTDFDEIDSDINELKISINKFKRRMSTDIDSFKIVKKRKLN